MNALPVRTMHTDPITVAITGMNALPENPGPGLAVARCLREALGEGVRIIGLGYDALDPGMYLDTYTDVAYLLSYPLHGSEALLERLQEIQRIEQIDVLIPCLDAELPLMVALAEQITAMGIRTFLPDATQLQRRTKDRLPELCKTAAVGCPEIQPLNSAAFFYSGEAEGWSYPLVVKGPFYDAKICRNAAEATAAFYAIAAEWGYPVLAQRFIAGEEYNLAALGDGKGAMLGEVMMKKRALTAKGKAWAGIAINDAALGDFARRLVAELKWKGPLEVEVMRDEHGQYQLIEINPRFPAWIYLSQGVGRNLPALLLDLALGRTPEALPASRPGTMFIRYAQETIVELSEFETMMINGSTVNFNPPFNLGKGE
jgi:carbamoyl-phosphate synthase large subunit